MATSAFWFLEDIVGYSSGIYGRTLIAKGMGLSPEPFILIAYAAFSISALFLVLLRIERWGRKRLQAF